MSTKSVSQFAPYSPPPDDSSYATVPAVTSKPPARPWFPVHTSSQHIDTSYQSGGIPTFGASAAGGAGAAEDAEQTNQWETRYGMRVDVLAAVAYLLGPISALVLLVTETRNDYVRFHAYQSALLLTPLVLLRIFAALVGFWSWLQAFLMLSVVLPALYMAFHAYRDAAHNGLTRYRLPRIGQMADDWVADE